MQIKGKYSWAKHLDFSIIDIVALLLSFFTSYYLKFKTVEMSSRWMELIVIIVLLNIVITLIMNPYSGIFRRRYYQEIRRSAIMAIVNLLFAAFLFYIMKIGKAYSRDVILHTYFFYFFATTFLKYLWKKLLLTRKIEINTTKKMSLFIITDRLNIASVIRNVEAGDLQIYHIKGAHVVSDRTKTGKGSELVNLRDYSIEDLSEINIPIIGDEYVEFILKHNIEEVLIAVSPGALSTDIYKILLANGVGIDLTIESTIGFQTEEQYITNIGIYKALSVGEFSFTPAQSFYLLVKRCFDIICGIIGIIALIPVSFLVKIITLTSGDTANIFYKQERVGQNGKPIKIFKYRTMVPNADEMLQEMLKEERWRKEWADNQKFDNDPRITKAGKILRKTSIDELPQVINVLKGEMSLIGPRPLVEGELEEHNGLKLYQKVKPGITGWWACNGRSNIDYRERLELEYYYIKNCSFYLDFLCIIRTVVAVLKKDGAQ